MKRCLISQAGNGFQIFLRLSRHCRVIEAAVGERRKGLGDLGLIGRLRPSSCGCSVPRMERGAVEVPGISWVT